MIVEPNPPVPANSLDDVIAPASAVPPAFSGKLVQYAMAATGPIASAATQFLLSLVMLRLLQPEAFGTFTFLLVASQMSWGVWSALFCAPLPVLLLGGSHGRENSEATLVATSTLAAVLAVGAFVGLGLWFALPIMGVACFGAYGGISLIRWFARSHAYVHGRQLQTMRSDLTYSITVLATLTMLLWVGRVDAERACYAALLGGAIAGMLPFGATYARTMFASLRLPAVSRYGAIWRGQGRWALIGVLTTEATANAHVYLITALQGPAAFAPLAAASLLVRPVNVAQNALSDFERPQMARLALARAWPEMLRSVQLFRLALAAVWTGTMVVGVTLFATAPTLIFPASYDLRVLSMSAILWAVVAALRLAQTPESTMLQAGGAFRPLALASVWSSIATVAGVLGLVLAAGPLWSMTGLILGSAIFWYLTRRYAQRWLSEQIG
jgi:hypothetical protein